MKKVVSSEEDTSDETDVCSDLSDSETPLFKKKAPPKKKSPSPKVKRARTCARDISASFSDASLTLEPNRGRETSRSREPSHSPAHSRFSEPVSSSKLIRPPIRSPLSSFALVSRLSPRSQWSLQPILVSRSLPRIQWGQSSCDFGFKTC